MLSLKYNIVYFMPPDPIRPQGYQDTLHAIRPENDPDAPPHPKPGDSCIVVSTIIGLLIGGALGFFLPLHSGLGVILLSTFGGIIIGGILGALVGEAFKRRRFRHRQTQNPGS
jgi:hypothetical protein